MWFLLLTSIFVGLLDGLGLTMFIPLLDIVASGEGSVSSGTLGNLGFIVDSLNEMGIELNLVVVLMTMLFFFIAKGFAKFFERYLRVVYQQYFISRIRFENIDALVNYSYEAFTKADAGKIQNTLSGEVEKVMQGFRMYSDMLQQFVMLLTYASLAVVASPQFAILIVIGGFLTNLLFSSMYKKTKLLSVDLVKSNHLFQGFIIQSVAFYKYLKATASIKTYKRFLKDKVNEIEHTTRKMGILNSIMMGMREPLMISVVVAVILIQVKVLGGNLSTVMLSLLFFYRGLTALSQIQTSYNKFLGFSGSIDSMKVFTKSLQASPEFNGDQTINKIQAIEFQNLSFSYDKKTPVLKNIDLIIQPKQSIAFIGESGSGKTTLVNLLAGLLKPDEGELYINQKPITKLELEAYRRRIGYITQEPIIFDDTLFNNVTLWDTKNEQNLNKFRDAIRKAQLSSFIAELNDKEDERLGNNGVTLSGGQKQRISIARELYKDVDMLLMDEATSALDTKTEKNIQKSIDALKGEYTIIIIAHRLSTIRNCDNIVLLDKGKIKAQGNYKTLINKSTEFAEMINSQQL
jgi:subfamily B ATP-binding cassette protein MsbA